MRFKFEYRIVLIYLLIGFLWIFFSDRAILLFTDDIEYLNSIQTIKGAFYVVVTAIIFFLFLKTYLNKIRKAQKELERKILYFYTVLNNLPIGVSLFDTEKNRTIFLNKASREILELKEECGDFTQCLNDVLADGSHIELTKSIEVGSFYKSNWNNISLSEKRVINILNIKLDYHNTIVSSVIDITDLDKKQKQLIKAKDKAQESDKLKSAFLSNMSHEIRTPMNGILGFMDLIKHASLNDLNTDKYYQVIEKSSQRLLDTFHDIIEISKIESGELEMRNERFDIKKLTDNVVDLFKAEIEAKNLNYKYNFELEKEKRLINSDKQKVEAILANFIKNAIKFTEEGFIEIECFSDENGIVISVEDSGRGIPEDSLEKIFKYFVQADLNITRAHEGSGLGLTISKTYADVIGAKIKVKSEIGKGSVFSLIIPFEK